MLLIFLSLFTLNIFFFWRAFGMNFFKDDFFFLKISRIHSVGEFAQFFSPIRTYSYKPLASEVFYFLIGRNAFIGHIVTFITYFVGLYFLYKCIYFLSKNDVLAKIVILIYSLSSIHVFQLYWLATFQEVLVLTTLSISFYLFLQQKHFSSILFYICALLSKETAILYIVFLGLVLVVTPIKSKLKSLIPYIAISFLFFLLYQYSLKSVTSLDNYKVAFDPRLILNNALWYYLWSWGAPNFLPDYMRSIFSTPIQEFWTVFALPHVKMYFYLIAIYLALFFTSLFTYIIHNKDKAKNIIYFFILSFILFFIFLGPILLFPHKWMVRLTIPLIFISAFQAYILFLFSKSATFFKTICFVLITLYLIGNYYGVKMHEDTSMFNLETKIVTNADTYFKKKASTIKPNSLIYFSNNAADPTFCASWGGCASKLENTFHGSFFLDYYFPDKNMRVEYGGEGIRKMKNTYIINSSELIK